MTDLFLYENNSSKDFAIFSDNEPIAMGSFCDDDIHKGDIFLGRAREYQKNTKGCFVDIGDNRTGFVSDKKLLSGENYLVQVVSPSHDGKGAELTEDISFTNCYSVITFSKERESTISFSKKLKSESLKRQVWDNVCLTPVNGYNISLKVRTAYECEKDFSKLSEEIESTTSKFKSFSKNLCGSVKCVYKLTFAEWINNKYHFSIFDNTHTDRELSFYQEINKFSDYNKNIIRQKSGSWIKIEKTEAMYVIDVNSGSSKKSALEINRDATKDILRALRLNNYSGIIIIDYINITKQEEKILIDEFSENAKLDYTFCHPLGFTKLGLLEVQRSRV